MADSILVFAIGNASRGDDALGPALLQVLAQRLPQASLPVAVDFLEDFQLQIEHAMDMHGRKLVLFVDAGMDTPAPFLFQRLQLPSEPTLYSHALAPESMLAVYRQFYEEPPPAAFVLCIHGEKFKLGEPLSAIAQEGLERACDFAMQLLAEPDVAIWEQRAVSADSATPFYRGGAEVASAAV